jgi:hypothetical protein
MTMSRASSPRYVKVQRTGPVVAGQPTVLGTVEPPLTGNGWGDGTSHVILISRNAAASIDDILAERGPAACEGLRLPLPG